MAALPFLVSCENDRLIVETFQQMATSWEENLHSEFQREASFYDYIDFKFNIAQSPEEMSSQIDAAVKQGANAIVVNPFSGDAIVPAIENAYDKGVKVVLVGQKVNSSKYTSFVGTDNKALGRAAASYICNVLDGKANIIVIESYRDAPFYKDRYSAFMHEIDHHEDVNIVASFDAAWDADKAHEGMDSLAVALKGTPVDAVFAFSDDALIGAKDSGMFPDALYVGLDGLIGKGLAALHEGKIDATFTNPTNGDVAVRTAVSILNGNYVQTEIIHSPQVIDSSNEDSFIEAVSELLVARHKIDVLNDDLEWYKWAYESQKVWIVILAVLAGFLLICSIASSWHAVAFRKRRDAVAKQLESVQGILDETILERDVADQLNKTLQAERQELQEIFMSTAAAPSNAAEREDAVSESVFMKKFRDAVNKHLDNPDLSINILSEEIGVSRAQLYRKVKANSGETPNDLIQAMRLEKAFAMLRDTDMTVSEVAYSVGFTSPSYFSKCYKDKFGMLPKDVKSSQNPA